MGFWQEISDLLGLDFASRQPNITFIPQKGVVVHGYKKLLAISDTQILLSCKNKEKLKICGKNLQICSLSPEEIAIKGNVEMVGEAHD